MVLVDNEDLETFFHEFGHHLEGELMKISPETHSKLNDWYEQLFKDEFENFGEFFAEFVSDSFIRMEGNMVSRMGKSGLATASYVRSSWESAFEFFKTVIGAFYHMLSQKLFGKFDGDFARESARSYFDVVLREMLEAKSGKENMTQAKRFSVFVSPIVLGLMPDGTDIQKADMLTRFMLTVSNVLKSATLKGFLDKTPEAQRKDVMERMVAKVLRGFLVNKKEAVGRGKYVYVPSLPWEMGKQLGDNLFGILSAARPMFDFVRQRGPIWKDHKKMAQMILDSLEASKSDAERAFKIETFHEFVKRAEALPAESEAADKLEKQFRYFRDYLTGKGRWSRYAGFAELTDKTKTGLGKVADAEAAFFKEMNAALDNKMSVFGDKVPTAEKAAQDIRNGAKQTFQEIVELAAERGVTDTRYLDDLYKKALVMEENADQIGELVAAGNSEGAKQLVAIKKKASYYGTVNLGTELRALFEQSGNLTTKAEFVAKHGKAADELANEADDFYKTSAFADKYDAYLKSVYGKLPEGTKTVSPKDFESGAKLANQIVDTTTGQVFDATYVLDDVTSDAVARAGNRYSVLEGLNSVTAFEFDPKIFDKANGVLVIPRNLAMSVLTSDAPTSKKLFDFVVRNPRNVMLTDYDVFSDMGKPVIKEEDAKAFAEFSPKPYVPSDFAVNVDDLKKLVDSIVPMGTSAFSFGSKIKHGLQSVSMAAYPLAFQKLDAVAKASAVSEWKYAYEVGKQFGELFSSFKASGAPIDLSTAVSALSVHGKTGDLMITLSRIPEVRTLLKDKVANVRALAIEEDFMRGYEDYAKE